MEKEELLQKLAALQKLRESMNPVAAPSPGVSDFKMKQMEQTPELQMQNVPMNDVKVQQTRDPSSADTASEAPLTQIDNVEARKAALERLQRIGNQQMKFRGGFLDGQGVFDHDE